VRRIQRSRKVKGKVQDKSWWAKKLKGKTVSKGKEGQALQKTTIGRMVQIRENSRGESWGHRRRNLIPRTWAIKDSSSKNTT